MKNLFIFIALTTLIIGCFNNSTNDSNVAIPDNILPMAVGNEWKYAVKKGPNNSIESYRIKCFKDTLIDNEQWFVFQIGSNSLDTLYATNRSDGIYLGGWGEIMDSKRIVNVIPKNGQLITSENMFNSDSDFIYFKSKEIIQTSKNKYEAYMFRCEKSEPKTVDAVNFYLVPGIGIVYMETVDLDKQFGSIIIKKDIIKDTFDLKSYILK